MKLLSYLHLLALALCIPIHADSWRVFVYMDSSDDLSDMAIKNITDMVSAQPTDSVELLIQLHAYDDIAHRYHVVASTLQLVETLKLSMNSKQDFIDAADWAFDNTTANHTMLICWNHGWGILDPQWNDETEEWETSCNKLNNACPIKRSKNHCSSSFHKKMHKGFMFSKDPRNYLSNQDMIDGLQHLTQQTLQGKKLDIIAFDTCMAGMLEVAYQVAPYADYLVGNQTCALRDGFNYLEIIPALNNGLAPRDLAIAMVDAFDRYYAKHDERGIYAHTALDLSRIDNTKDALNTCIKQILLHVIESTEEGMRAIFQAAKNAPRFCLFPMYTDLIAFFKELEPKITDHNFDLKKSISSLYTSIEQLVVARCSGSTIAQNVHGVAIYLPQYDIDKSYYKTLFGNETAWAAIIMLAIKSNELYQS